MKTRATIAMLLGAMLLSGSALAQGYPTRNLTMIVPFPAGGPSDTIARIMAEGMGNALGQTVVVEIVSGAGGCPESAEDMSARQDSVELHGAAHHFYYVA